MPKVKYSNRRVELWTARAFHSEHGAWGFTMQASSDRDDGKSITVFRETVTVQNWELPEALHAKLAALLPFAVAANYQLEAIASEYLAAEAKKGGKKCQRR
jgi:hypothetical protein